MQYEIIRTSDKKFFFCYIKIQVTIQKFKKDCYPIKEAFHITITVEIKLQLNHTTTGLFSDEVKKKIGMKMSIFY